MNDKIKHLLATAEKFDGLADIKRRIANREQLRKERKEKLKELMEKDKQQTSVQWLFQQFYNNEGMITTKQLKLAEIMNQIEIAKAFDDGDYNYHYSRKTGDDFENGQEYYQEVYGEEI